MNTRHIRGTLLALLLTLPGFAQAVSELESNNPVIQAQVLEIGDIVVDGVPTTGAIVEGVIGNKSGAVVEDQDFYTFSGVEGDVVTVDIDGNPAGGKVVDTILAIFGPGPSYAVLRQNDDIFKTDPIDPGSKSRLDSLIVNFRLPATGTYVVGVSGFPRDFVTGGGTVCRTRLTPCPGSNGGYKLLISGVSPPVLQINIDIKPGSGDAAPINPKSRGKVPVALLGATDFVVDEIDTSSLTFGHSGNESSLIRCGGPGDVDGDTFPDLVCHFENQDANWNASDDEGILRGQLRNGKKFEGRAWLKVVPVKAEQ